MNQVTVGILTPHTAPGPEVELPSLSDGQVRTLMVRAGSPTDLGASTEPAAVEEAAGTFRSSEVDAVAHASTTTGYLIGPSREASLASELERLCGVPAFATCAAAVAALRAGGAERIHLVHPPWFAHAFDELGVAYFRVEGFDVIATRAEALPNDPALVEPGQVVDWVEGHLQDQFDGIYLAGNGFRTGATVDELRRRTGKVVVSANQALLQALLSSKP